MATMLYETMIESISRKVGIRHVMRILAAVKAEESPFSKALITEGRNIWFSTLEAYDAEGDLRHVAPGQPLSPNTIRAHLRLIGDPDKSFAKRSESFTAGIRSGAYSGLEFTPAVYEAKESGELRTR